ncbi:baseplate J/gp47 family protein [Paraburkholderia steynii]|uniref:baseplate J/gp47 family protein n=1 Tax=Paraburkholderia steynii TaxID=1245441 RepID=UPI00115FECDC|nr:baseplate J/gp47 family protein [Paraburkholderia steynii]
MKELEAELVARARAWVPSWGMEDDQRDFGRALLKIAAQFASEVTARLDRGGEKLRLGLLDWLAVPRDAARPARLPIVFKLADSARDARLASAPALLQVEAGGASVMLETETDVLLVPGGLQFMVGVDSAKDAYYLPPPGLTNPAPLDPLPTRWQCKSFASAGSAQLQLDPEAGLAPGLLLDIAGEQYEIVKSGDGIVTLDWPLTQDVAPQSSATKVTAFMPFDPGAHDHQEHALYIGHKTLFDLEAAAAIEILGTKELSAATWHYWGKGAAGPLWLPLKPAPAKTQARSAGIVLLKPKGAMEVLELAGGKESRWIRASIAKVSPQDLPIRADTYEIRINCIDSGADQPPLLDPAEAAPRMEAMANTTPLVLDNRFYPFGKEPRQFDAFYLGSAEVFSKQSAEVKLHFDLADATFSALTPVMTGTFANKVMAGVARDGALHLIEISPDTGTVTNFRERGILRPVPPAGSAAPSSDGLLDERPRGRLPVWSDSLDPAGFLVAAGAKNVVWIWRENSGTPDDSQWKDFGTVKAPTSRSEDPIADLIFLQGSASLVALQAGQLWRRDWPDGPEWVNIEAKDASGSLVRFEAVAPVLSNASNVLVTSYAMGMIGVSDKHELYRITVPGKCTRLNVSDVDSGVRPVAVFDGATLMVALAHSTLRDLALYRGTGGELTFKLDGEQDKVTGFEAAIGNGKVQFLAAVAGPNGGYLLSWPPPAAGESAIEPFRSDIPSASGMPDGMPLVVAEHVVIPESNGNLLVAPFHPESRKKFSPTVKQGLLASATDPSLEVSDTVVRDEGNGPVTDEASVTDVTTNLQGEVLYSLEPALRDGKAGVLKAFHHEGEFYVGAADKDKGTLTLDKHDSVTARNSLIRIEETIHRVSEIDVGNGSTATLVPAPATTDTVQYKVPVLLTGRTAPFLPLDSNINDWDPGVLSIAALMFPGAQPRRQTGRAFKLDASNHPLVVVLDHGWKVAPQSGVKVVLDTAVGQWARSPADITTNPELSWEYWNGSGWWRLPDLHDGSLHLKASGDVTFAVPVELAATDWSGRTNFWIRARLTGGDYGREEVSVESAPTGQKDVTRQIVKRSTAGIRAPAVIQFTVSYAICKAVLPELVMTRDSGSLRDQSDANSTGGAMVEAFIPLAVQLGRLWGPPGPATPEEACAPDCDRSTGASVNAGSTAGSTLAAGSARPAQDDASPANATTAAANPGRALYLGFDSPLLDDSINLLLLVEEEKHDAFAPMTVEAFIGDRFTPLVIEDRTRALGESELLVLSFPVEPTPHELFGQTLKWLRLAPGQGGGVPADDWRPKVLGAYLNGVWASAAETLTYELLGSSQGEPDLTLWLARPPVLKNTLELRVREPLGDEERAALLAEDKSKVLSAVENLLGDWVLWQRVIDPADEAATARVYALDEETGEIRFGDGRHGRIPPIGRDCIVAFVYRRTEPGAAGSSAVPGNAIAARTALNLVSPIEGVEAVYAADQAAGGAPAEDVERVLRFGVAGLRHRDRAVTAADIEQLTLAHSPKVAQARCFPHTGFVQLVIVMQGANPRPGAADVRELHRLLIGMAPPTLAATQALRIVGPDLRRLRVDLRLRVASLDVAGSVASEVREQIRALFDSATGGVEGAGWPLGESPGEADVGGALADVPQLEGIAGIELYEIGGNDSERPWPATLQRTDLVWLDKGGVRITFETPGAAT